MELRKDISKFITQICEKNYSSANSTLETLIEKKLKAKVKKMHNDCCKPCSKKKKKIYKENIDDSLSIGSNDESPYDEAAELDDMEPFEPFEEPKEKDFVIKRSAESDSPDSELTDIEQNGEHFATFANQQSAKKFLKKYMGTAGIHTNVLMKDDQGHYTSIKL